MRRTLAHIVLGIALSLTSLPFVSNGWTAESDVISFISGKKGNFDLYLMDINGEILRQITFKTPSMYGHTWSPDSGSFAYVSNKDGNNDIYVMDLQRKTNRRLTHHPSTDFQPAWSPDGKWVAFTSDRDGDTDIYRMDTNGKNVKKLTNQGECNGPTWSPDSQSIAFISSSEGRYFVYVMGANGRGLKRLVGNIRSIFGCAWSPDGKQIAFVSRDAEGVMGIFSIGVSGKNLRQLTQLDQRAFIFNRLAWSPSGEWIAYVAGDAERSRIYKTDVNGAHPVELTAPGYYGRPAWSPDGKQIAFVSLSHDKVGMRNGLYVMNANGKRLRRVADRNRGMFTSKCDWSPDGKQIAFSLYIRQTQRYHLCVIDEDGENFRQLTRGGPIANPQIAERQKPVNVQLPRIPLPEVNSPAWSPDGKRIAYVYSDTIFGQTADLYIIDAKGKERGTPLVKEAGIDVSPAWVPEGFLSVSPSAEKLMTLWGRLKQTDK